MSGMRRLLLLSLFASPAYAIGIWGSLGMGTAFGGAGSISVCDYTNPLLPTCVSADIRTSGSLIGFSSMVGLSLRPIPLAIGIGADIHRGYQVFRILGDIQEVEVERLYIKFPIAYHISLPQFTGLVGIYPAGVLWYEFGSRSADGFALGGFFNLYYSLGSIGFGVETFFDYGFEFSEYDVSISDVLHYGIRLGVFAYLGK